MKANHCDECKHALFCPNTWALDCQKGHKPRFYAPRSPVDTNYGYKRVCLDFEQLGGSENGERTK